MDGREHGENTADFQTGIIASAGKILVNVRNIYSLPLQTTVQQAFLTNIEYTCRAVEGGVTAFRRTAAK